MNIPTSYILINILVLSFNILKVKKIAYRIYKKLLILYYRYLTVTYKFFDL